MVLLVLCHWPDATGRLRALASRYAEFQRDGTEILAVPLAGRGGGAPDGEGDRLPYPIVEDSAQEVAAAYRLFRRDLSPDGLLPEPPLPHHMELLVDRQGYVRARWVADGAAGWADPARLLAAAARLAKEPPAGPPPDEHIH